MTILLLDASKFLPYVGDDFTLTQDGSMVNGILAKVVEYPANTMPGAPRTAFSLFFHVQHQAFPDIQSGNYSVEHRSLGVIGPVYIERILSPQPETIRLEAVFN
ncbi:hypothetical protein H4S14_003973 [Agrobacterium vitis]|nr:hypothetical protein [Agrobacterium vitis]MBE1440202.1 hypothetical protein [Agrobacterium vitis]